MSVRGGIWLLFAVAGCSLLASGRAWACSCAMPGTPAEEMARSAAVLAGRVLRIDVRQGAVISTADPERVVFQVERVWKGPAYHTLVVVTARDEVSCGFPFEVGQEYLVYARAVEGELHASLCSRTALVGAAGEDLAALGPGMTLVPDGSALSAGRSWVMPLLLTLAALIAGAVLVVMVRREHPGEP